MIQRILALVLFALLLSRDSAEALRFYVNPATGDDRRSHIVAQTDTTAWRTLTHALKVAHLITAGRPHVIELAANSGYSPASGETLPFEITQTGIYISAQSGVSFDAQSASRIFTITAPTSDFVLRNVSLLNGSADLGGAVYCETCSLRVANTRIIGNTASTAGDAIYVKDGRLRFYNNTLRVNGTTGGNGPLIDLNNTFTDTSQRDQIRNNTFYLNKTPAVRTSGNRTDINSNIFNGVTGDGVAAIVDAVPSDQPHIRNNLFWDVDVLYASNSRDSLYVVRTVRDTVTLAEQGVDLPSFVTNQPDTIAKVGSLYEFDIQTTSNKSSYNFNKLGGGDLPAAMLEADWDAGILRWTPTLADTGRHALRLEVIDTGAQVVDFVSYVLTVFKEEDFPDTTGQGPTVNVTMVPDTTGAIDTLNSVVASFSTAASSGGNKYGNPLFLNTTISRFELLSQVVTTDTSGGKDTTLSVARDAGDPAVALYDADVAGGGDRNDMGFTGGPLNADAPTAPTTAEIGASFLPDSLVVEGNTWTYSPTTTQTGTIILVDYVQGPPTLKDSLGSGKSFPLTWTPTLADTGSWLVGVRVLGSGIDTKHYFPLRVRAANEPPRITSTAPTQAFEDSAFTYSVIVDELDGDPVTFALTSAPEGMSINASGVITWTPSQADTGSVSVSLSVTDDGGESATQSFTLVVLNTNDAPTISQVADTSATEDLPFSLQLSATDIDVADTSFVFTLQSGPDSVVVDSTTGLLSWTPLQADVGFNLVKVKVADPQGAVDSTSFLIEVIQVDDPPIISSTPDTTAPEDALYEYTVDASSEEGEVISFELVTAPAQMTIDTTGTLRWTPTQADTGRHDVEVQVSDPTTTVSQSFTITVSAVNDAPVLVSRAPADSFFFFDPGQGIVFSVSATDEEGDLLSYRWLVDGILKSETSNQFLHVPDTTTADTVVTRISDGTDSTLVQWVVDARAIPIALIEPDSIDFGSVLLGDSASTTVTLSNPGRTTLLISNLQVSNLELTSLFSASQVLKDESETLDISYVAASRGALATTISFDTNDPDRATITIPVSGFGQIPTTLGLDVDPTGGNQGSATTGGTASDTVSVDLYVTDALDITQYTVELSFDPAILSVADFALAGADTNILGSATAAVTEPSAGTVQIAVTADSAAGTSGGGALGRLRLAINADATPDTQSEVQLTVATLLSETFTVADTLRPDLSAVVRVRSLLPADLTDDGIVDFDDFFLFADLFGSMDARGDLNNSGGIVDFDDFFLFADSFGTSARLVPVAHDLAVEGLHLVSSARPSSTQEVEAQLAWSGEAQLRGAATWVEFDPRHLSFSSLETGGDHPSLLWSQQVRPGLVQVTFGRGFGAPAYSTDLPILRFDRHDGDATRIRLRDGLGHGSDGLLPLRAPEATVIDALPAEYLLYPAYPNPFNPATTIPYFVPTASAGEKVVIRVYDLLGQPVRTLVQESRRAGHHSVTWHGLNDAGHHVAAGVYLIEFTSPTARILHKALYLK